MQIFARAIVVPVLFLPIVGIIVELSSILSNPTIVGNGSSLINIGKYISSGLWPIAIGVIKHGSNIQVIYGPKVTGVRSDIDKYLGV